MLLFMRYGVKSVTMDDVSRELGISKKTLYKYVTTKDDLILHVMEIYVSRDQQMSTTICSTAYNAIDELQRISAHVNMELQQLNPALVFDLQKYHRPIWEHLEQHHYQFVGLCMLNNILRGRREGLYRDDFNAEIVARLHVSHIHSLLNPDVFPHTQFKLTDIHNTLLDYHMHAICTPKGIEVLAQLRQATQLP